MYPFKGPCRALVVFGHNVSPRTRVDKRIGGNASHRPPEPLQPLVKTPLQMIYDKRHVENKEKVRIKRMHPFTGPWQGAL